MHKLRKVLSKNEIADLFNRYLGQWRGDGDELLSLHMDLMGIIRVDELALEPCGQNSPRMDSKDSHRKRILDKLHWACDQVLDEGVSMNSLAMALMEWLDVECIGDWLHPRHMEALKAERSEEGDITSRRSIGDIASTISIMLAHMKPKADVLLGDIGNPAELRKLTGDRLPLFESHLNRLCSIYIPSKKLYVDLQDIYFHGISVFDGENAEHLAKYDLCMNEDKGEARDRAICWRHIDPARLDYSRNKKKNHLFIYVNNGDCDDIADAIEGFKKGVQVLII